jgi:hypothetical protein
MDDVVCRVCGTTVALFELRDATSGSGCTRCEGSLLCERCGHPRPEHFGVYVGAKRHGCDYVVRSEDSLAQSRCGCDGYLRATRPLAEAAFANENVRLVDTVTPRLRVVAPLDAD